MNATHLCRAQLPFVCQSFAGGSNMYKRDFEARSGFHAHLARQTTELSEEEKKKAGQVAAVQRSSTRPGGSLLQLQRQYGNRYVQRVVTLARATVGEGDVMPDVERAIEGSRGGGQSLDSGVQTQMGQALNADFSGVRVHTDAGADGLNQSLSAKAFTTGRDIYFRQGEDNPGSYSGRSLLAHELTHVVQQNPDKIQTKSDDEGSQSGCTCGSSAAGGPQMKLTVSQPGDQYEQEADRIANAVMQQEQHGSAGSSQAQSINRQMPEEDKDKLQGQFRNDRVSRQVEEKGKKPV